MDERRLLQREAGKLSLAAHIRQKLFGETETRRRGKRPSCKMRKPGANKVALGQVLAALGRAELLSNLATIAKAAKMGALPVTPELIEDLHRACGEIFAMRVALMRALGIKADSEH